MYTISELLKIFSKEQALVILISRLYFNTATKEEVVSYISSNAFDYKKVQTLLAVHGIRPFWYNVIKSNDISIDTGLAAKLKEFFLQNQLRSMDQAALSSRLQMQLKEKGLQVIPFKGAGLASAYYGNIGLRESADIDFLVAVEDVEKIEEHLRHSAVASKVAVPAGFMKYYKKHFKEIIYTLSSPGGNSYSVELHWLLLNKYYGPFPQYWFFRKGVKETTLHGLPFFRLNPSYDFIAIASNHFVKDMGIKFKYLVDVACLVRASGNQLDVNMISDVSETFHCRKRIDHGLHLVSKLLGVKLAGWKYQYECSDADYKMVLQVPLPMHDFNVTTMPFIRRSLQLQDNLLQRARFIGRCCSYFFLPTDNDIHSFKLPPALLPLMIVARPFRLVYRKLISLWSRN